MSWRELVSGAMGEDLQARRASNLASSLPLALKGLDEAFGMRKKEAAETRTAARTAAFGAYPETAARTLGMDVGESGMPAGMRETKRTVGGRTYETPDVLDETGIAKIYTDYVTKVQGANASASKYPNYEPIPVPTFVEFVTQNFPEYIDTVRSSGGTSQGVGGGNRIKVKRKSDGKLGNILESDFNSSKYTRL